MDTWGVTDAGGGESGVPLDYVVEARDWSGGASGFPLPGLNDGEVERYGTSTVRRRAGEPLTVRAGSVRLPSTRFRVDEQPVPGGRDRALSVGRHRVVAVDESAGPLAGDATTASISFRGPALVEHTGVAARIDFGQPTDVTVTVSGPDPGPPTVRVPDTPAGLAAALGAAAATHDTPGPDRSHPARRPHPPLFERGSSLSIPDGLETPDAGIELTVPAAYDPLFVAAPLAYYLGATVRTADVDRPVLRIPGEAVQREFDPLPAFQRECADLLRQVFHLDALLGGAGGTVPPVLADAGLDPDRLGTVSPAERTARYLEAAGPDLASRLPGWHLSTYAEPSASRVPALPYLLDDLSLVYLPDGSELDGADLLDRTLSETYRGPAGAAPSVDVLEPELKAGRVHAWMAPGTPIDAFKTTPDAYENRREYRGRRPGPFSVTVVLNDGAMAEEHAAVADIYEDRAADIPMDLRIREGVTTDELAAELSTRTDFLHYIGHCETGGLRCVDGTLSTADLDRSRTRTFFLNACGSYHEGLDLVDRGSLAGAVTRTAVLDSQAATVGTAFARLLMHGFSIERAMRLARRRILMGTDYVVVGDGTDSLVPTAEDPTVVRLADAEDGYRIARETPPGATAGRRPQPPAGAEGDSETTVPAADLRVILEETALPVVYDGEFHWSSDLADAI